MWFLINYTFLLFIRYHLLIKQVTEDFGGTLKGGDQRSSGTDALFSQNCQFLDLIFVFLCLLSEILDFLPTVKEMINSIHIHDTLYLTWVQFPRLAVTPKLSNSRKCISEWKWVRVSLNQSCFISSTNFGIFNKYNQLIT